MELIFHKAVVHDFWLYMPCEIYVDFAANQFILFSFFPQSLVDVYYGTAPLLLNSLSFWLTTAWCFPISCYSLKVTNDLFVKFSGFL